MVINQILPVLSQILSGHVRETDKKQLRRGFPGGSVANNLPANAGDTDLIPDLGGVHTPLSN